MEPSTNWQSGFTERQHLWNLKEEKVKVHGNFFNKNKKIPSKQMFFFVMSLAWYKEKILTPLDSTLWCLESEHKKIFEKKKLMIFRLYYYCIIN